MRDVMMLLLIAAFFAVCVAYVWYCDRIIGPDPEGAGVDVSDDVGDAHVARANAEVTA